MASSKSFYQVVIDMVRILASEYKSEITDSKPLEELTLVPNADIYPNPSDGGNITTLQTYKNEQLDHIKQRLQDRGISEERSHYDVIMDFFNEGYAQGYTAKELVDRCHRNDSMTTLESRIGFTFTDICNLAYRDGIMDPDFKKELIEEEKKHPNQDSGSAALNLDVINLQEYKKRKKN